MCTSISHIVYVKHLDLHQQCIPTIHKQSWVQWVHGRDQTNRCLQEILYLSACYFYICMPSRLVSSPLSWPHNRLVNSVWSLHASWLPLVSSHSPKTQVLWSTEDFKIALNVECEGKRCVSVCSDGIVTCPECLPCSHPLVCELEMPLRYKVGQIKDGWTAQVGTTRTVEVALASKQLYVSIGWIVWSWASSHRIKKNVSTAEQRLKSSVEMSMLCCEPNFLFP